MTAMIAERFYTGTNGESRAEDDEEEEGMFFDRKVTITLFINVLQMLPNYFCL
jgi:hypothetical protein